MIETHKIQKSYGNVSVLKNVSLSIKPGKLTMIIGPNGAGKSTYLNIMARMLQEDHGEIIIDDKPLKKYKKLELAKKMAVLKQSNQLQLRLTVEELVAFGRYPHSQGRLDETDDTYIEEALRFTSLTSMRHKYLHQLSGGQQQRAYIAMVLAQNTDIILLDEPLASLDLKHSLDVMRLLKRLTIEQKKTIVIVVHDVNMAGLFADDIIAMKEGQCIYQGTVDEVFTTPVLEAIYDIPFNVQCIQDKKFCIAY